VIALLFLDRALGHLLWIQALSIPTASLTSATSE